MNLKIKRVICSLMALALISSCAISGTFAKYVTRAEGEDSARVAKWGILLTMEGDELFKSEYEADDPTFTGNTVSATVKASNEDKLVAPGTSSDGFSATVVGTPEVATRYTLEIPAGWTDIVLPAGEYTDYTQLVADQAGELGYNGTFTLPADYSPVKWDITVTKGNRTLSLTEAAQAYPELAAAMGGTVYGFSASNAKTIVERYHTQLENLILSMVSGASNPHFEVTPEGAIKLSLDFDAGKEMNFAFNLRWAWDFDDNGAGTFDKADTFLGNVAAGVVDQVPAGVSTDLAFSFVATATQID